MSYKWRREIKTPTHPSFNLVIRYFYPYSSGYENNFFSFQKSQCSPSLQTHDYTLTPTSFFMFGWSWEKLVCESPNSTCQMQAPSFNHPFFSNLIVDTKAEALRVIFPFVSHFTLCMVSIKNVLWAWSIELAEQCAKWGWFDGLVAFLSLL